ncbi:progranulin-like [Engraulis encrasicolus]|uniref:progranulin-like n=1 Tax=Engraulis encrasicolus TaxID=184585 RepID=UPI002FD4CFD9
MAAEGSLLPVGRDARKVGLQCDDYHNCPDSWTCCQSIHGGWACCPYPLGQCCADGFHCCPQGSTCDLLTFRCLSGSASIPASPQLPAVRTDYQLFGSLPMQDPCCLNGDEAGCCQVGFHCDRERRVCVADLAPLDIWTTLEQGQGLEAPGGGAVALRGVIRCDGRFYCPADHSCCRTPTGEWGCCPYRLGVCCTDGRHCCDYHMTCDESSLSCNQGENSITSASMGQILRI